MRHKGDIYGISSMVIWGIYPIITIFTYQYVNFMYSLAISSFFSIFFFLFFFFKNKEWNFFKVPSGWSLLLAGAFINGVLYSGLLAYGLLFTTAINASILDLSEIFFSYLLFGIIFAHKKSPINEIMGSAFLLIGVFIFLFPGKINFHYGDIFVLLGALVAPIGNQFVGKTLKLGFSSNFIMLLRSIMSSIVLFGFAYFYFEAPSMENIIHVLPYLLFSGIVLLGFSKYSLVSALKTISVARLSSFFVLYPLSTICYNILFFGKFPELFQIIGCIPLFLGVLVFYNIIKLPSFLTPKA